MSDQLAILLLTDGNGGAMKADLDILYPDRVTCLDFTSEAHGPDVLGRYSHVITQVTVGANAGKLDYDAVDAFAKAGGQVVSCLFEYAAKRGLHFSKTHVLDRMRPAMRIEAETDVTRGYAVGDEVWWFGSVSSAPEALYENQMVQRQVMGVLEDERTRVLGTSTVNGGAVMVEERVGDGRILALDLASPGRPFYNSHGATNKYLFVGNVVNNAVRYGRHFPERLSYDAFVDLMHETAFACPGLTVEPEGPASDGREMWSFSIGDPANPTMYFGAAVHGWEWENAFGLLRLAEILSTTPDVAGLDTGRLHFRIMPIQNPWGYDHFTRQNGRGVDLNRNFDCAWDALASPQDLLVPWDYNYKGARAASEPETQVIQGLIDREHPTCVIDFHTADYVMLHPHKGDKALLDAIQADMQAQLQDRFLCQKPYNGAYQQVNMTARSDCTAQPYLMGYAAEQGADAAFLIEMSGNRDDTHGLVMVTDTVVELCLAAVRQVLAR